MNHATLATLRDRHPAWRLLTERIVNAMRGFKEEFKAETVEMDVSLAALPEYERISPD